MERRPPSPHQCPAGMPGGPGGRSDFHCSSRRAGQVTRAPFAGEASRAKPLPAPEKNLPPPLLTDFRRDVARRRPGDWRSSCLLLRLPRSPFFISPS